MENSEVKFKREGGSITLECEFFHVSPDVKSMDESRFDRRKGIRGTSSKNRRIKRKVFRHKIPYVLFLPKGFRFE